MADVMLVDLADVMLFEVWYIGKTYMNVLEC